VPLLSVPLPVLWFARKRRHRVTYNKLKGPCRSLVPQHWHLPRPTRTATALLGILPAGRVVPPAMAQLATASPLTLCPDLDLASDPHGPAGAWATCVRTEEDDARALLSLCQQLGAGDDYSPRVSPCSSPRSSRTFGYNPSALTEDGIQEGADAMSVRMALEEVTSCGAITQADRRRARDRLEEQFRSSSRSGLFERQGGGRASSSSSSSSSSPSSPLSSPSSPSSSGSFDPGRWQQQVAKIESKAFDSAVGELEHYHLLLDQLSFIAIADHCSPTGEPEDGGSGGGGSGSSSSSNGGSSPLRPRSSSAVQCSTGPSPLTLISSSSSSSSASLAVEGGALTVQKRALAAGRSSGYSGGGGAAQTPHRARAPKRRKLSEGSRNGPSPKTASVPWTDVDDELLKDFVQSIGTKWTLIGTKLTRTGKQCRERWCNHVDPQVSHEPWTEAEDAVLLQAHVELGNQVRSPHLPNGHMAIPLMCCRID
jgi:hypothetical protein